MKDFQVSQLPQKKNSIMKKAPKPILADLQELAIKEISSSDAEKTAGWETFATLKFHSESLDAKG